jgi:MFS family permease
MTTTSDHRVATEPAAPEQSAPLAPAAREPLGRRFAAALGATGLANLGDGVLQVGAPLVALTLTRNATQISLLSAAAWLPWLLLGLAAGVAVDRADRRRTQMVAMVARALVLGAGVWLVTSGHLTMAWLVAIVLAYGVTEVFADLAQTALVPDLVPRSRLQAANGRVLAVQQVANTFVGGPVAGAVLALGAGWVLGLPAGLAVGAAVLLWRGVRGSHRATPAVDAPPRDGRPVRRALDEVRDGLTFLAHHRVLRPLVVSGALMNMAFTAYFAVFVLWAVGPGSRMGLRPGVYPLLLAVLAVGAVVGSLLTERIIAVVPELRVLLTCWVVTPALLVVPVLAPSVGAVAATLFVAGVTTTVGNVLSQAMRQRLVPAALLGRVGGAGRTLSYGLMPLGAVLGGVVADAWGLAAVFWAAATVSLVAAAYPALVVRQTTVAAAELPADVPITAHSDDLPDA